MKRPIIATVYGKESDREKAAKVAAFKKMSISEFLLKTIRSEYDLLVEAGSLD